MNQPYPSLQICLGCFVWLQRNIHISQQEHMFYPERKKMDGQWKIDIVKIGRV